MRVLSSCCAFVWTHTHIHTPTHTHIDTQRDCAPPAAPTGGCPYKNAAGGDIDFAITRFAKKPSNWHAAFVPAYTRMTNLGVYYPANPVAVTLTYY